MFVWHIIKGFDWPHGPIEVYKTVSDFQSNTAQGTLALHQTTLRWLPSPGALEFIESWHTRCTVYDEFLHSIGSCTDRPLNEINKSGSSNWSNKHLRWVHSSWPVGHPVWCANASIDWWWTPVVCSSMLTQTRLIFSAGRPSSPAQWSGGTVWHDHCCPPPPLCGGTSNRLGSVCSTSDLCLPHARAFFDGKIH